MARSRVEKLWQRRTEVDLLDLVKKVLLVGVGLSLDEGLLGLGQDHDSAAEEWYEGRDMDLEL